MHLKIFPDLRSIPLFNGLISAECASCKLHISQKAFSISLKPKHSSWSKENLHFRDRVFFFSLSRIKCIGSDTVPVWFQQQSSVGKKERKRERETEARAGPGAGTSVTSQSATTRTDAPPSLWREVGLCAFLQLEKTKKEKEKLNKKRGSAAAWRCKSSRRCTKALCESLLSNNVSVTAARLFQFQAPRCSSQTVSARLTCRCH